MTENKPIIIDGVDVAGCDFLAKEDDYCSYSGEYRAYKGECGCSDGEMCKDYPNCFYKKALKQLAHKTQECKQAEEKLEKIREVVSQMNNECFYDDFDCKDCDMKNGCTYLNKRKVLQIIDEVMINE